MNQSPPVRVSPTGWRRLFSQTFIEDLFFIAATVFSFMFAFSLLYPSGGLWQDLLTLIVFWAMLACLAMPRLNQILTSIHVPDCFMGSTKTADGILGDRVNPAVRGSAEQPTSAMRQAGWTRAAPVRLRSTGGSSWGRCAPAIRPHP